MVKLFDLEYLPTQSNTFRKYENFREVRQIFARKGVPRGSVENIFIIEWDVEIIEGAVRIIEGDELNGRH